MGPLTAFGLCAALVSGPATGQDCAPVEQISSPLIDRWQSGIAEASRRFAIPEAWIRAVMKEESAGRTTLNGRPIISSAGAMGLIQLMPGTWSEMRDRYGLGRDPYEPRSNILAGTAYLREMYDRYGFPGLFAAYHAGPGRMDAYLIAHKPLPEATRIYLESVVPGVEIGLLSVTNSPSEPAKPSPNSLFFVRLESEISSHEQSNSKTPKSDSESGEVDNETGRSPEGDSVHDMNDLFVPLTRSAQ
ncbi:MAG TPA: lytic transglycosylase domain-containing protein [Terriglobales bacterium]|nr:lytic transglycosylase domain-containing protein [Terriglobales bacterium]